MTNPELDDDIEYLDDLDDGEFRATVLENLGVEAPGRLWAALRDAKLVDRTIDLLRDVLAEHGALAETKAAHVNRLWEAIDGDRGVAEHQKVAAEHVEWRRSAGGFQRLVETRLQEVKAQRQRLHMASLEREKGYNQGLVRALARSINRHRLACADAGLEPEAHDEELWGALDGLRIADEHGEGTGSSLSEMVLGPWADSEAA